MNLLFLAKKFITFLLRYYDNANWSLSSQIGSASLKRSIEGVRIFKSINNPNLKIIFTGYAGLSNLITNTQIKAKIAKVAGISHQSIIIKVLSYNGG